MTIRLYVTRHKQTIEQESNREWTGMVRYQPIETSPSPMGQVCRPADARIYHGVRLNGIEGFVDTALLGDNVVILAQSGGNIVRSARPNAAGKFFLAHLNAPAQYTVVFTVDAHVMKANRRPCPNQQYDHRRQHELCADCVRSLSDSHYQRHGGIGSCDGRRNRLHGGKANLWWRSGDRGISPRTAGGRPHNR